MEWDWNEVDGVTTLSAPEGAIQGPLRAGLVFAVGRADETMTVAGITHAVEHLALRPMWDKPHGFNGSVSPVCTRFVVQGGADDVVESLREIVQNLRDLPVDALEQELQVLRVEERRHTGSHVGEDLSHRFGPRGVGLIGWPEHGLKLVGPDKVVEWARAWFTADNAVLWTSAPLPEKVDLAALPQGPAPQHLPAPQSQPPPRTFCTTHTNLVSVSAIMEQQVGINHLLHVAQRRAFGRLRLRDAIAYAIDAERMRIDAGHSLVFISADGNDGTYTRAFEGLVDVWDELADAGPTEAEWDETVRISEAHDHAQLLSTLDHDAEREVLGLAYWPEDTYRAEVAALTPEAVRDNLAALGPTLGGVVPNEVKDGGSGWTSWTPRSTEAVDGVAHQPIAGRESGTLVVGDAGVSWIADDNRIHTVGWSDAVCTFAWDDGRRTVLGPNGEWVSLIPWYWRGGQQLTKLADGAIDAGRRIRLGEGDTQYLRDPADPQSTTDVRWLASITGGVYLGARVDLVVDTDGFFLLFSHQMDDTATTVMQHLRRSDRRTLLGADPRNRWISHNDIELVQLSKKMRARLRGARRVLVVTLRDGTMLGIELVTEQQAELADAAFQNLLGPLFQA